MPPNRRARGTAKDLPKQSIIFKAADELLAFVSGIAAPRGVERQFHENRLMRTLRAGLPWAQVTVDADPAEHQLIIEIVRSRIAELARILKLASECDGETMILGFEIDRRTIGCPADREIAVTVGKLDE